MLKVEDFMLEETREEAERKILKKGIDGVKEMAFGFLGKANGLYRRASRGDPNPMLVGKAIAYLTCFQDLAPVIGIKKELYLPVIKTLWEKLGEISVKVEDEGKKTIIEHRRDPAGIKVEQDKLELDKKKVEVREAKAELTIVDDRSAVNERMIEDVSMWLHRSLGYDKKDADRRARMVYKPGASLEELISAGCRV
jgi:hypothetical protein